jgi:hypothetical protein
MKRKRARAKSTASNPEPETNGTICKSISFSIPFYIVYSNQHCFYGQVKLIALPRPATSPEARPNRSASNAPAKRLQRTTSLRLINSNANSEASINSRRSSLNEPTAHVGGFDIDAARPAKKTRLSGSNRSNASTNERSSFNQSLDSRPSTRRTRKEESLDVPLSTINGDDAGNSVQSAEPSENGGTAAADDQVEVEYGDVIRDLKPVTPLGRRRGRGRLPKAAQQNLAVGSGNESVGQQTPARSGSRVNGDGVDSDPDRSSRVTKRLPGRRRAPNPNASIEADLRRQLQLKMGYRAVAKALKPVLAELAKRAADELVTNEDYHKENEAYEEIISQLDQRLQDKIRIIDNEKRILSDFQERSRTFNSEYLEQQFEVFEAPRLYCDGETNVCRIMSILFKTTIWSPRNTPY